MEFTNEIYTKYEKMVYSSAHYYARTWKMSVDDLIGDGMEIFFIATQNFDESRGVKFSTYLTYQLKRLNDRAKTWTGKLNEVDTLALHESTYSSMDTKENSFFENILKDMDFTVYNVELLDSIATELSKNAQNYLSDLLKGTYATTTEAHRPTVYPRHKIAKTYGITVYTVDKMREEIKTWWSNYVKSSSTDLLHLV